MDILTERGQTYVEHEKRVIERLKQSYANSFIYHTPINAPASLDLISTRNGRLVAVAEVQCRNNSVDDFHKFGSLILTWTKVEALINVAVALYVPGLVILYSIPDDVVLIAKVVNPDGSLVRSLDKDHTVTQKSCNGGQATRLNAYIPIEMFGPPKPEYF